MLYRFSTAIAIAAIATVFPGCESTPDSTTQSPPGPGARPDVRGQDGLSGWLKRPSDLGPMWNWYGQALPTGDLATSVITVETLSPSSVNVDSSYDYTIRVRNVTEAMMLTDLVVADHLPASGFEFETSSPEGRMGDNGSLLFEIPSLAPKEHRDIVVRGKATATGKLRNCTHVDYRTLACVTTEVVEAQLQLQKRTPLEIVVCDEIPISVTVRNPGTGVANNVVVVDKLPAGWTVDGRSEISWDIGSLPAGESRELKAVARAKATGTFVNTVTATADGGLRAQSSTQTAVRRPVLTIAENVHVKTQILGREATFDIVVENRGDYPARDCLLVERVSGAEKVSAISDGGTLTGSQITWNLGSLGPGAKRTFSYKATRATEGSISGAGTVTAYCAEQASASAETKYVGVPAILLEVVDDPDPIVIGNTTTYTIHVTNQGTARDTNLVVRCVLDKGVEFVSASGASAHSVRGSNVEFAPLATLAPKAHATWTVVVRGTEVADTRFAVALETDETSRPIEETESTRFYK